jgi:hypothetical protein
MSIALIPGDQSTFGQRPPIDPHDLASRSSSANLVCCTAAPASNRLEGMLEPHRSGNRAHFAQVPIFQGFSAEISPQSMLMLKAVGLVLS